MYTLASLLVRENVVFVDVFILRLGNVNVTVITPQYHTVIPEGYLVLNYTSEHHEVQQFHFDIFSSALTVQQTLQALNPEITVSSYLRA